MSYDYNEDGTEKSRYKLTSTHDEHGNPTRVKVRVEQVEG